MPLKRVSLCVRRQGFDSSDFLENAGPHDFGPHRSLLASVLPALFLLKLISRYFIKVAVEFRRNFFSHFVIQNLIELQVAALLNPPRSSFLSGVALCGLVLRYSFLHHHQRYLKTQPRQRVEGCCSYVVFLVRRLLYVSLLFATASRPSHRAALSVGVAAYLVFCRPYESRWVTSVDSTWAHC
jgi:hypothetical protein